jgi:recombination protein RecR
MENLPSINRFLKQLQQIPYLASKNVYRVMHHFLEMSEEQRLTFINALRDAQENVIKCYRCWAWQERLEPCSFCDNPKRDHTTICVVENWHDLYAIERSGAYKGHYHVLGGVLSPLEGIHIEHIKVRELVDRVNNLSDTHVEYEIILALNQTPEGEATSALIGRLLKNMPIRITCLARGVPVGSSLEFTDRLTVHKAISERRAF